MLSGKINRRRCHGIRDRGQHAELPHRIGAVPIQPLVREADGSSGWTERSALAILGGVSSLLLPIDDILPPEVRRVHIAEICGSNFLFGSSPPACSSVERQQSPRLRESRSIAFDCLGTPR